ncbi:excinuclease ABC subunit A, partial [Methylorubrum sp. Q1]
RGYDAGRFSFNVAKGRCPACEGEGFVSVELLFMPSVYAPCPTCHGSRYAPDTLELTWNGPRDLGLGYLRQPATELSGGEAQRIKLATELQRGQRGGRLYVLDEPTTGLHPTDVDRLMLQLNGLVDAGNAVVMVEHDTRVVAGADHVIDVGPGAGSLGGTVVTAGRPEAVAEVPASRTAPYLREELAAYAGQASPPSPAG